MDSLHMTEYPGQASIQYMLYVLLFYFNHKRNYSTFGNINPESLYFVHKTCWVHYTLGTRTRQFGTSTCIYGTVTLDRYVQYLYGPSNDARMSCMTILYLKM